MYIDHFIDCLPDTMFDNTRVPTSNRGGKWHNEIKKIYQFSKCSENNFPHSCCLSQVNIKIHCNDSR